jgi:hypothetical protein
MTKLTLNLDLDKYACYLEEDGFDKGGIESSIMKALGDLSLNNRRTKHATVAVMHFDDEVGTLTLNQE